MTVDPPHDHDHDDDNARKLARSMFEHPHLHGDASEEEPMDAANQSLADALRASFRILKWAMFLAVVYYLASGIHFVQPSEEAVVFRFGRLLPTVYQSGSMYAWPFPVDEVVRLPVKEADDVTLDTHMLWLSDAEKESKSLSMISRGHEGLDPNRDGALLTGDQGLVHIQWKVTYKIGDLLKYVRNLSGKDKRAAENLVAVLVENAAVETASAMKTEDVYRRKLDDVCAQMKMRVNRRLTELESGVEVTQVKAPIAIVPLQLRNVFDRTQAAENEKARLIDEALKDRTETLSGAAGKAFEAMLKALDERDAARRLGKEDEFAEVQTRLEELLETNLEGHGGEMVQQARSYYARVVNKIEGDLNVYRSLITEYRVNPRLLFERLWNQTRAEVLGNSQVTKIYRPSDVAQVRLKIGPDPEQEKLDEIERYQKETGETPQGVIPRSGQTLHPIGPEYD